MCSVAIVLIVALVLIGCDRDKEPGAAAAEIPAATADRVASEEAGGGDSASASQPAAGGDAVRDYVRRPRVHPEEVDAGPERIISMAPSLTELAWAMGLGDRLVGRTQYCLYPPAARDVEVIGALLDPNVERILTLEPDLVLVTASSSALQEKFASLGLPVEVLPDSSLEDIFAAIERLGRVAGRPKTAAMLAEGLREDLSSLRQRAVAGVGEGRPRVLLVTGALPEPPRGVWVAGPESYLDTLLEMAGAENALSETRSWLEVSAEQVLWLGPDVIVEVREPPEVAGRERAVAAWRRLPGLSAVRVVTLPDPAMLVPGPRINVMLAKLIEGLHAD
jgi:iron complex transport system substrate-binding protein